MKRFLLFLIATFALSCTFAQNDEPEESYPSRDTEIVRRCSYMDIEGEYYHNVVVTLKSYYKESAYLYGGQLTKGGYRVKVIIKDENGKKVYKKTFKNCYLYIFTSGQVQVGKPKFNQIIIGKAGDSWFGEIREKEGVW